MKIINYKVSPSPACKYEGTIEARTDQGDFKVCYNAGNFCLHDGEFFNQNSEPMAAEDFNELRLEISENGRPILPWRLEELKVALEEAIVLSH